MEPIGSKRALVMGRRGLTWAVATLVADCAMETFSWLDVEIRSTRTRKGGGGSGRRQEFAMTTLDHSVAGIPSCLHVTSRHPRGGGRRLAVHWGYRFWSNGMFTTIRRGIVFSAVPV